ARLFCRAQFPMRTLHDPVPLPAVSFLGGFRTPAPSLGARGPVRQRPASETLHRTGRKRLQQILNNTTTLASTGLSRREIASPGWQAISRTRGRIRSRAALMGLAFGSSAS